MGPTYRKYIFFRDDDVAKLNGNLRRLLDIFISHEVPIHLSVIPEQLTKECRDFLIKKMARHGDLIEIGQHGHQHRNYSSSNDKFRKYEFGEKRSCRQQNNDIVKGNEILQRSFKKEIDIFTPPWHGFDENTVQILAKKGFSAISTGRKELIRNNLNGLKHVPVNINFNKKNNRGEWFVENNVEIVRKISRTNDPKSGILLHHDTFNDQREFRQLDRLLHLFKKDKSIEFISLSEASRLGAEENTICYDALAYYLNYQFVPKPLAITMGSTNPVHKRFDFDYRDNPGILKKGEDKICKKLYSKLREVVLQQLPARGKPIGLLLSGGLDSAAILHTLRDITDRKIYTLTGAYHKGAQNLISAKQIAKTYNTIHSNLIITPESIKKIDELYGSNIPQPIGDNGFLATYLMIDKLKKNTDHIFTGDGADCLFCGLKMHYRNIFKKKYPTKLPLGKARRRNGKSAFEHYRFGEIFLSPQEVKMLFEGHYNNIKVEGPLKSIANKIKTQDPVKRQTLLDLNFLVRNRVDYIIYAAKACGANVNLPYLDKKFVNFALRIPAEFLLPGPKQQKYMLKKAFEGKLSLRILKRKGEGFTPPFRLWYYENKEFIIQKLIKSKKTGISTDYIKYLVRNIKNSDNYEMGMKIWLLVNLVSWHERITKQRG